MINGKGVVVVGERCAFFTTKAVWKPSLGDLSVENYKYCACKRLYMQELVSEAQLNASLPMHACIACWYSGLPLHMLVTECSVYNNTSMMYILL